MAWRIHELYSPWDHKESETTEQLSLKVDTKVNQKGTKVRANVSGKGPNHGVFLLPLCLSFQETLQLPHSVHSMISSTFLAVFKDNFNS